MTDITELAQREKFEAWAEEAGALPWGILKKHRNQDGNYPGPHYTYMWKAWQAASAELVEALEKAQSAKRTLESLGYTDNGGELWRPPIGPKPNFSLMDSYRHRIAELESRTVTVKLSSERFRYGESDYDDGYVNGWNARMAEDTAALDRVGIKWEAE